MAVTEQVFATGRALPTGFTIEPLLLAGFDCSSAPAGVQGSAIKALITPISDP